MSTFAKDIFLEIPSASQRRCLHPCRVVGLTDNVISAEPEEDDLALEAGQELLIYYTLRRQFVKQPASVESILEAEGDRADLRRVLLKIETTGDPVLVESRQCFRVSTVMAGLTVSCGDHDDCPLVDISVTGFAFISLKKYAIGTTITATPRHNDVQCTGRVCIQSARVLNDGRFRYGVHCMDRDLQDALQKITMELQRQQMRRLACRV